MGLLDFDMNDPKTAGLLNLGLGILMGNTGRPGDLGQGVMQGVGNYQNMMAQQQRQKMLEQQQQMQQEQFDMQKTEYQRKLNAETKQKDALSRLLSGQQGYITQQDTPVSRDVYAPIPAAVGAQAPNFGMAKETVTENVKTPVFNNAGYMQDLIDAGYGGKWIEQQFAKKEPIKLGKGDSLYDPNTYQPLVQAPKEQEVKNGYLVQDPNGNWVVDKTLYQAEQGLRRAGASTNNVSVNTGQKGFDNTLKLRGDFRSEPIYKAHQDVKSAYSQISTALKQNSPAGDLAGATKIMKILDPGSVVRESELGMAMAASGALDRLTNYADMVIRGTKLTPNQRKDFQTLADALYQESSTQYNAKRQEYQGIAERNGLDTMDVLGPEDKRISNPTGSDLQELARQELKRREKGK